MDLTIIGGGITGLAAAYMASKTGKRVRVLEGGKQFGGLLSTFEVGGSRLERYYHHFFTHDAEIRWLLKELGLEDQILFESTTMGMFRDGKTYPFNGPADLLKFRPLGWIDKLRFALSSYYLGKVASPDSGEEIPASEWLRRWAGEGTAKALWDPLLNIKFGPYADQVPLRWMIGRMRQRMGSRKSASEEKLGYLNGSLARLLEHLIEALRRNGVELVPEAPVREMVCRDGVISSVKTPEGEFFSDEFLATIPTVYLAPLVRPILPGYAEELDRIRYFGAKCVVLEMTKPLVPVYWLNVADPGFPFGGVIEQTNLIGPENYQGIHIAYLSRYFSESEEMAALSDKEVVSLMLGYLPKLSPDFDPAQVTQTHVFTTRTAATVCDLNFAKKVPSCRSPLENLFIANMAHVYPDERSVNNSIRVAAEAVKVMGIAGHEVPKNQSQSGRIGFQ